jgi:NADH-quinone oxidoreductase subunit J
MEIKDFFVYLFGFLMILSSLGVIFSKKSLNSALCLVATMALVAIQFALMRADFVASLQILVYAGAIMILFVFVIMLLGVEKEAESFSFGLPSYLGVCFSLIFLIILINLISQSIPSISSYVATRPLNVPIVDAKLIGKMLLVDYMIAFQAVGVLLLAAIIAAAMLAFSGNRALLPGRGLKAVQKKFQGKLDDGQR